MLSQILNFIASVKKLTLLTVDVGDVGYTTGGAGKAWVVGEHATVSEQMSNVNHVRTQCPFENRQLVLSVTDLQNGMSGFRLGLHRFNVACAVGLHELNNNYYDINFNIAW